MRLVAFRKRLYDKKRRGERKKSYQRGFQRSNLYYSIKKNKPLTRMSVVYVGIYYLTKIFFALLALDFVILEPDLSNATIL